MGVGAVLSQREEDNRHHPCAFLSHCLTPTERNYHVGDHELLAVKLAFWEWIHWLEGAKHSFQVLIDHKNLEYIQQAKQLNPCQARWSLFFIRFQFMVSYHPGSKNIKLDALSRHASSNQEDPITPIVLSSKIVATVRWELENTVRQAQAREHDQVLQVLQVLRSQVLQWSHSSHLTCHPGTTHTLEFLQRQFWWPTIEEDTKTFVSASLTCNQAPSSLYTSRPWSHLSMYFITRLPSSQGNTTIMVIVDRFSKAGRFIPLPKLPSAKKTSELMFFESLAYHRTLSLIEALRFPGSGGHFVNFWRRQ